MKNPEKYRKEPSPMLTNRPGSCGYAMADSPRMTRGDTEKTERKQRWTGSRSPS